MKALPSTNRSLSPLPDGWLMIIFRVVGSADILSASSPAQAVMAIRSVIDLKRTRRVSIQIAMSRSWGDGFDWGDVGLIPGLGKYYSIPVDSLSDNRVEIWNALVRADEKWQEQRRMVDAFSGFVANQLPASLSVINGGAG